MCYKLKWTGIDQNGQPEWIGIQTDFFLSPICFGRKIGRKNSIHFSRNETELTTMLQICMHRGCAEWYWNRPILFYLFINQFLSIYLYIVSVFAKGVIMDFNFKGLNSYFYFLFFYFPNFLTCHFFIFA